MDDQAVFDRSKTCKKSVRGRNLPTRIIVFYSWNLTGCQQPVLAAHAWRRTISRGPSITDFLFFYKPVAPPQHSLLVLKHLDLS